MESHCVRKSSSWCKLSKAFLKLMTFMSNDKSCFAEIFWWSDKERRFGHNMTFLFWTQFVPDVSLIRPTMMDDTDTDNSVTPVKLLQSATCPCLRIGSITPSFHSDGNFCFPYNRAQSCHLKNYKTSVLQKFSLNIILAILQTLHSLLYLNSSVLISNSAMASSSLKLCGNWGSGKSSTQIKCSFHLAACTSWVFRVKPELSLIGKVCGVRLDNSLIHQYKVFESPTDAAAPAFSSCFLKPSVLVFTPTFDLLISCTASWWGCSGVHCFFLR